MSWDVRFFDADSTMGPKASVREKFLSACDVILGTPVSRQGPTEVSIDDSFCYETLFIGSKHDIESLCLSINILDGNPHGDPSHPACAFVRQIVAHTGWQAEDAHNASLWR